jgi:TetR/AcrR family transcriptional regulator, mexJK operon transcriptional repressor
MSAASQAEIGRPGAGRPSRAQVAARQAELLDTALDMFLERGFELTTMEAVAAAVGMAKRTVYARYPDKAALFLAAVSRAIERSVVPRVQFDTLASADLEATLIAFARMRIAHFQTAEGLKLQRIVNTESFRFPEIFTWYFEQGAGPAIGFLTDLLDMRARGGEIEVDDPALAANIFMSMVIGGPVRTIVAGMPMSQTAIERRIDYAVGIFLKGIKPR